MEHESVSIHLLDYTAGATVRHTHYAQMVQLKSYIVVALCWPTWYLKEPALSKRVGAGIAQWLEHQTRD